MSVQKILGEASQSAVSEDTNAEQMVALCSVKGLDATRIHELSEHDSFSEAAREALCRAVLPEDIATRRQLLVLARAGRVSLRTALWIGMWWHLDGPVGGALCQWSVRRALLLEPSALEVLMEHVWEEKGLDQGRMAELLHDALEGTT